MPQTQKHSAHEVILGVIEREMQCMNQELGQPNGPSLSPMIRCCIIVNMLEVLKAVIMPERVRGAVAAYLDRLLRQYKSHGGMDAVPDKFRNLIAELTIGRK